MRSENNAGKLLHKRRSKTAAAADPDVYNLSVYKEYIIGYLPQLILTFTSDNTKPYNVISL